MSPFEPVKHIGALEFDIPEHCDPALNIVNTFVHYYDDDRDIWTGAAKDDTFANLTHGEYWTYPALVKPKAKKRAVKKSRKRLAAKENRKEMETIEEYIKAASLEAAQIEKRRREMVRDSMIELADKLIKSSGIDFNNPCATENLIIYTDFLQKIKKIYGLDAQDEALQQAKAMWRALVPQAMDIWSTANAGVKQNGRIYWTDGSVTTIRDKKSPFVWAL